MTITTAYTNDLTDPSRGAATELLTDEGNTFVGVSGRVDDVHPVLQAELDSVPKALQPGWHGQCAEISCINQALHAGVDPAGVQRTVGIGLTAPGHGLPKAPCTSCAVVLPRFGVR
jgi:hypothetical protein